MAKERARGEHPEAENDDFSVVAYEAVVTMAAESEIDETWVLGTLAEQRPRTERLLTGQAVRRFGPGYSVRVTEPWRGGSVHQLVLLAIEKTARTVAVGVDDLRRFAGEVELAIAFALELDVSGPEVEVEMRTPLPEPAPGPPSATDGSAPWERIAPILGAVATGIGVLGFVTFVGGAIDWARFHATGLPQEQALAVVPTQDLVVVGARILVPAMLAGLLACVLYAIGRAVAGTPEERISDRRLLAYAETHAATTRAVFLATWFGVFAVGAFLATLETFGTLQFVVFVPLGLILAGLTYAVAKATSRFAYLALTLFLALSVFMGGIAYARALDRPELRAAAIVRQNQKAVIGFFVAESGGRVYLARLDGASLQEDVIDRSSARLIGIDKDEVSDMEVGAPRDPALALKQASELADELCGLEIPHAVDPSEDAEEKNCWSKPPGRYVKSSLDR